MASSIKDSRAFIGALAFLIVGTILSLMVAFYMLPDIFGRDVLLARWWWEIVLNLQILCLAFMWFCHHERLIQAEGLWRFRAIGNFMVGVISVSYPLGLLLISAWFDWFRHPPSEHTVLLVMLAAMSLWMVGSFLVPIVYWLLMGAEARTAMVTASGQGKGRWLATFWPTFLLVALLMVELTRGGRTGFAFIPILMYIQGAMPYLRKARRASPRDADI